MKKYGCTICNAQFDTFEEALPHHNQITGHNICTPPIDCPRCAKGNALVEAVEEALENGDEINTVDCPSTWKYSLRSALATYKGKA